MIQESFLDQIKQQRENVFNNTVRRSSLNYTEKNNIYNELDNIYSNDCYPRVNSVEVQTDDFILYKTKKEAYGKKTPYCTIFTGVSLISITLLTINNFLIYYFTNIEIN